jgi:hypothetical protein
LPVTLVNVTIWPGPASFTLYPVPSESVPENALPAAAGTWPMVTAAGE